MLRREQGQKLAGLILLVVLMIAIVVLGVVGTLMERSKVGSTTQTQIPTNVSVEKPKPTENTTSTTVIIPKYVTTN